MDRCTSCQFYDRQNRGQDVGQCRRAAPALSPINVKAYMIEGVWPTVRDDDWCGEWRALVRRGEARASELLAAAMPQLAPQASPQHGARVAPLQGLTALPLAVAIGGAQRGND